MTFRVEPVLGYLIKSARISDKTNRHRQRKNIIKQKIAYRSKVKNSDHKKRS